MSSKRTAGSQRQAVLVLGMHRSGTSALAGTLVKLGVAEPKTTMPPTPDNPRGYWESSLIMRVNDEILASAGSRWDDWEKFNPAWATSAEGQRILRRIPAIIEEEFGDAQLFVIKDPRICRFLPAWKSILEQAGVRVKVVIPFRHPIEVAGSLAKRDRMTNSQGQLIWLRHILDAESSSRGIDRVFVHYPELLRDWRTQVAEISQVLGLVWPRWSGAVEAEIDDYLTEELRHHVAGDGSIPESTPLLSWVARTYRALMQITEGSDGAVASSELDAVRDECEGVIEAAAPVFHDLRGSFERRLAEARQSADDARDRLQDLVLKHDLSRQEVVANYQLAMDYKGKLEDIRNQFQNRENLNATLQAGCDAAEADAERRIADSAAALAMAKKAHADEIDALHSLLKEARRKHEADLLEAVLPLNEQILELKEAKHLAEEVAQERSSEIYLLSKRLLELEQRVSEQLSVLNQNEQFSKESAALLARQEKLLLTLRTQVDMSLAAELGLRRELDAVSGLLGERSAALARLHASVVWRVVCRLPGTSIALPVAEVETGVPEEQVLRKSSLLDVAWYLKRYPDVKSRGMDPVRHYLEYGAKERRDPGPAFSTAGYAARYPDVIEAGINPLVHYIQHGRAEGRRIFAVEKEFNGSGGDARKN